MIIGFAAFLIYDTRFSFEGSEVHSVWKKYKALRGKTSVQKSDKGIIMSRSL